ncbi:MAG: patatin-like phospholipase family protein [Proteobacteria bacterium]|nr:patatin-like phospholipase family protein [Pseudomonadota bacterium]
MPTAAAPTWPALVLVTTAAPWSDAQGLADASSLTTELAAAVSDGFGDKVAVLEAGTDTPAALRKKVLSKLRGAAYVFVDAKGRDAELVNYFSTSPLRGKAMLLVPLMAPRGGVAPGPEPVPDGWRVMRTILTGSNTAGHLSLWKASRAVRKDSKARRGRNMPSRSEAAPMTPLEPGLCRLRLRADCASDADYQAGLLRWARAVTFRRVALALAGSGAWGFAHLSLLRALGAASVPVDIITSTSSGTLIAAYYAALGDAGLDLVIRRRFRMEGTLGMAVLSTGAMELTLTRDIGTCEVQNLDVMFYPVAANLTSNDTEILSTGSLAFASRASSSAPGIFGPTVAGGSVYVDGAVSDNLPIDVAENLGGTLVIGSNPFPQETGMKAPRKPWLWPVGALMSDLNPFTRAAEMDHALSLNFHGAGEQEARGYPLVYEAPPEHNALLATFDFIGAYKFMEMTEATPEFQQVVKGSIAAWHELAKPRDPKADA